MDEIQRSQLRLPNSLHERLKDEARRSGRSLNAEIVYRLARTLEGHLVSGSNDQVTDAEFSIAELAERLAQPSRRSKLEALLKVVFDDRLEDPSSCSARKK